MKKQLTTIALLQVSIGLTIWVCWIGNIYRLSQCDFDPKGSWRGEAFHVLGVVIPPVSVITVWFNDSDKK